MTALDLISSITATVEPGLHIEDRMRKYGLDPAKATIRNGIIVEYRDNVNLGAKDLTKIPFRFVKVTGDFWCHRNQLTSLAGCPREVGGDFWCGHNHLTNLAGCPKITGWNFNCSGNHLTSLVAGPEKVGGNFICSNNLLTSLAGCPKRVGRDFCCGNNPGSAGFEKPEGVKGEFYNVSTLGTLAQVTATVEPTNTASKIVVVIPHSYGRQVDAASHELADEFRQANIPIRVVWDTLLPGTQPTVCFDSKYLARAATILAELNDPGVYVPVNNEPASFNWTHDARAIVKYGKLQLKNGYYKK